MNYKQICEEYKDRYGETMPIINLVGTRIIMCPFCNKENKQICAVGKKGLVSHIIRHHYKTKIGFMKKNDYPTTQICANSP